MKFKGTSVYEKSNEYAKSKCNEEIGSKFIPETNLTVYDACELDFRNGYNQALEDSKAKEMLEMLNTYLNDLNNIFPRTEACINRMVQINKLIKQATEF